MQQRLVTTPRLVEAADLARLELTVESVAGRAVPRSAYAEGGVFRIGAHCTNDLVIDDPEVAQFHCKLRDVNGMWRLEDMPSTSGTYLDGIRVRDADLPAQPCRLQIGGSTLLLRTLRDKEDAGDTAGTVSFGALRGRSHVMRRLCALLEQIAPTDATVLIEGESGTGKEVIANELVRRGPRKDGPLVIVDGGAITPSLVESELFGHVRGAFTGADQDRVGAFEAANGGTLFLDEIGELPLEIQPKLLRALESREIRRVGDTQPRKIDVRVIAATNRSLEAEVNQRRFREDLYFRLSVVSVAVPPLRARLDDIPDLVAAFVQASCDPNAQKMFSPEVLEELATHSWPGNVRELRNYVERATVLKTTARPKSAMQKAVTEPAAPVVDLDVPFRDAKEAAIEAFDQAYLTALNAWSGGNVSQAARRAGMDRIHLHRLLQRYGIRGATLRRVPKAQAA
ncbi:MAG: sigma 54-interacting transcriptional regulator [Polyangiaceae bacterium]|nr:sigma 54-interacting transcriptional regulator [Polyangiaceae bacterium]